MAKHVLFELTVFVNRRDVWLQSTILNKLTVASLFILFIACQQTEIAKTCRIKIDVLGNRHDALFTMDSLFVDTEIVLLRHLRCWVDQVRV